VKFLYAQLPQKDKVFTSHRVSKIDYSTKGVSVHCNNGVSFDGDLVVGADGIHSSVRSEMWRHAEVADPSAFNIKDKTSMSAEFNILFGMSKGSSRLPLGQDQRVHNKDCNILALHSKDNTVFWFLCTKLDKKYMTPNIPRYTKADAVEVAKRFLDYSVTETVKFGDLWEKRTIFSLHPIEEYVAHRWTWNRFVAIGDAVHKVMAPKIS
jgi:2-polyprenyl-6-methoxyphenol hydroxylase-like FAD-dependent oxidoreductase